MAAQVGGGGDRGVEDVVHSGPTIVERTHLKPKYTCTTIEMYKWRKVSTSADVFVWFFTSAYNRDVAAKLYSKI
jgi:hypothetical protein